MVNLYSIIFFVFKSEIIEHPDFRIVSKSPPQVKRHLLLGLGACFREFTKFVMLTWNALFTDHGCEILGVVTFVRKILGSISAKFRLTITVSKYAILRVEGNAVFGIEQGRLLKLENDGTKTHAARGTD